MQMADMQCLILMLVQGVQWQTPHASCLLILFWHGPAAGHADAGGAKAEILRAAHSVP